MKYSWHLLTLLLAVAVLVLSLGTLTERGNEEKVSDKTDGEIVLDAIMTRTSVRQYTDKIIPLDDIETILKAGMAAPTAGNRQPWEFYVVNDTNIIKQFVGVSKYTAPMNEYARTAIIVCGVPSKSFPDGPTYWIQDCSAATENILLATEALGYGAVWCGVYPGMDRVAVLRGLLDIPEELVPLNIIMMGEPNAEPKIKDKWDVTKVRYIK